MPVGIIGAAVSAGEFAYEASQAGGQTGQTPTIVALTPQQQKFFQLQAIQAQQDEEKQTEAYETSDATRTAQSAFLKFGLAILLAWFLWKVAKKRHWF